MSDTSVRRIALLVGLSVLTGLSILIGCLMSEDPRGPTSIPRSVASASVSKSKTVLKADAALSRSPLREPKYRGKPKYFLLLLGSGRQQVWCVRDGNLIYVDWDGDGDLTGPNHVVSAGTDVMVHDGEFRHRLRIRAVREDRKGKPGYVWVTVRARDTFDQYAFVTTDKKSEHPRSARVYHFDGDLKMRSLADEDFCFVRGQSRDLRAVVDTIGCRRVLVNNRETVPGVANPIAKIEFPSRKAGRIGRTVTIVLTQRC